MSLSDHPSIGWAEEPEPYGLCAACGAIEVRLLRVAGFRDLSHRGESDRYPVGYGCEVCA